MKTLRIGNDVAQSSIKFKWFFIKNKEYAWLICKN